MTTGRQDPASDTVTRCPACGADDTEDFGPYRNSGAHRHPHFDGLQCRRCRVCNTGWSDAPSNDALADYYGRQYVPALMEAVRDDAWPLWTNRAGTLLMLARLFGSFESGELFVDVGPGNGSALGLANWLLPQPRLAAVEFNETSIAYFKRHMPDIVITQSLADIDPAAMIYSSHSLEHVRPAELDSEVATIAAKLRPGGVFVLEVPLGETSIAGHHTPHLLFFSTAGVRALLERHGLTVQLCFVAEGRLPNNEKRIAERFRSDLPTGIGRVRVMQAGDLVPAVRPYQQGNTIKAFAVKV